VRSYKAFSVVSETSKDFTLNKKYDLPGTFVFCNVHVGFFSYVLECLPDIHIGFFAMGVVPLYSFQLVVMQYFHCLVNPSLF
jgi:hypothetical protein